jgi:hypothetical protein
VFGIGNDEFYETITWYTLWAKEKVIVRNWAERKNQLREMLTKFRQ